MSESDDLLRLMVALGRELYFAGRCKHDPEPDELVVEVSHNFRGGPLDPNAIGWLVGHDEAPYHEDDPLDGSVPMREVWDVRPLSGRRQEGKGYQRWENAQFVVLPERVAAAFRSNVTQLKAVGE